MQRTTYTIAGQAVFLRVRTLEDNVEVSNDLYAMHTDHLGSTSTLSYLKSDGTAPRVLDSRALYKPFGDYRLQPTGDYTDRGYTGHLHNNTGSNDIGLIYMNARFYVSGIARFASADTIVPNPSNPQSFNRYTYVQNSPLNFQDPTGHCAETGDDTCWTMYDRIVQICPGCRTGAATPGTTLDQYGYNYQKEIFNRVNNGWRPSKPALIEQLDFIAMSSNAIGLIEIAGDASSIYINKLGGKFAGSAGDILSKLAPYGSGLVAGQQLIENTNTEDSAFVEGSRVAWAVGKDAATDYVAGNSAVLAASALGSPAAGAVVFVACQFGCEFAAEYAIETVATNIAEFTYPYVNPWSWYNSLVAQSGYNLYQP